MNTTTPKAVLTIADDGSRLWVNLEHHCVARFSMLSGYEIYNPDNSMRGYSTSKPTEQSWIDFKLSVNAIYPNTITDDIEHSFGVIRAGVN